MIEFIESINEWAWVTSHVLLVYISMLLIVFVTAYYILFDPRATTAGKMIFRFMVSLVGVVGLIFVGVFIDPSVDRSWYTYPVDVAWWRPVSRLLIYIYVAYTITSLAILLAVRKWWPEKVKSVPDDTDLVKVRHPMTGPLSTRE